MAKRNMEIGTKAADNLLQLLKKTGYPVSKNSKMYAVMEHVTNFDSAILEQLQSSITDDNIITPEEQELYNKIIKENKNYMNEKEVHKALEKYYDDGNSTEAVKITSFDIHSLENEIQSMEHEQSFLEIARSTFQSETRVFEDSMKSSTPECKEINDYPKVVALNDKMNKTVTKVQKNVLKMKDYITAKEQDISEDGLNLAEIEQINSTFLDDVNTYMQNQFIPETKLGMVPSLLQNEDGDFCDNDNVAIGDIALKKSHEVMHLAKSIGILSIEKTELESKERQLLAGNKRLNQLIQMILVNNIPKTALQFKNGIRANIEEAKKISEIVEEAHLLIKTDFRRVSINNVLQNALGVKLLNGKVFFKILEQLSSKVAHFASLNQLLLLFLVSKEQLIRKDVAKLCGTTSSTLMDIYEDHHNTMEMLKQLKEEQILPTLRQQHVKNINIRNDLHELFTELCNFNDYATAPADVTKSLEFTFSTYFRSVIENLRSLQQGGICQMEDAISRNKITIYDEKLLTEKKICYEEEYIKISDVLINIQRELEKLPADQYEKTKRNLWILFLLGQLDQLHKHIV